MCPSIRLASGFLARLFRWYPLNCLANLDMPLDGRPTHAAIKLEKNSPSIDVNICDMAVACVFDVSGQPVRRGIEVGKQAQALASPTSIVLPATWDSCRALVLRILYCMNGCYNHYPFANASTCILSSRNSGRPYRYGSCLPSSGCLRNLPMRIRDDRVLNQVIIQGYSNSFILSMRLVKSLNK